MMPRESTGPAEPPMPDDPPRTTEGQYEGTAVQAGPLVSGSDDGVLGSSPSAPSQAQLEQQWKEAATRWAYDQQNLVSQFEHTVRQFNGEWAPATTAVDNYRDT